MQRKSSTVETKLFKGALRESGLPLASVAEKAGISLRTARMVCSGWKLTSRMRRRLEAALGRAIWTSNADFKRQQSLDAWLGFDPLVVNYKIARELAGKMGITIKGVNPSRALVLARIFAAFDTAHPAPPTRPKRTVGKISAAGNPPSGNHETQTEKRTP